MGWDKSEKACCLEGCGVGCGGLAPAEAAGGNHLPVGARKVALGPGRAGHVVRGCENHQEIMETADGYSVGSSFPGNRPVLEHWSHLL